MESALIVENGVQDFVIVAFAVAEGRPVRVGRSLIRIASVFVGRMDS
jgi:hypothetical protein